MVDEILKMAGVIDIASLKDVMVTLLGNKTIVITNIRGVLELGESRVLLKIDNNQGLLIFGEYLTVKEMNRNEIVISGRILKLEFVKV